MRHAEAIERLRAAAPALPATLPASAETYVAKVREAALEVTDADVEAMRAAGLDDESIFELTIAAALVAGLERLEAGLEEL
jgi:alkylhydroperoxidase family enzyme